MLSCPAEDDLATYMSGKLDTAVSSAIERHVADCVRCKQLLAAVARTESDEAPGDASAAPPSAARPAIGRYRLTRALGAGAMGTVYAAHDPELDRRVALKLVRVADVPEEAQASARLRVVREAQALARVSHPNVIHVYEVGTHEASVFIAMELIDGPNLRGWMDARRRSWREVLHVYAQAGQGLVAAHEVGLVHRDFKPDNVLVGRDGRVTVSDFGLARAALAVEARPGPLRTDKELAGILSTPLTRTGALLGTPAYMAPEQIEAGTLDARADVFSFCVALYEGLYGRRPFDGDTLSQILANVRAEKVAAPPRETQVPEVVFRVLARGLRARPGDRWGSMRELLAALEAAAGPGRVSASSARWLYAGAAGLAVLGVVVAAGAAWRAARLAGQRDARAIASVPAALPPGTPPLAFHPRSPRRLTFDEGCEIFPTFTRDGKDVVYVSLAAGGSPLVGRTLAGQATRLLTPPKTYVFDPAVSPDGRQIAYRRWSRDLPLGLYLMPPDGEALEEGGALPHLLARGVGHPSWSQDGESLWADDGKNLVRVDAESGATLETIPSPAGYRAGPSAELSDGSVVVVFPHYGGTTDGGVAVVASGREPRWLAHGDFDEALALAPDRRHALAVMAREGTEPELLDLPLDGSPSSSLGASGVFPRKGLAVSPDGRALLWSTCRDFLTVARFDTTGEKGAIVDLERDGGWTDRVVDWLPKKNRLAVLSSRGGSRLQPWLLDPARREPPRAVPVGDVEASGMAASPDGAHLALVLPRQGISLVSVDGTEPPRAVTTGANDDAPSFRHGGGEILFERPAASGGNDVLAVSTAAGAPGEPRVVVPGPARHATASPTDGKVAYFSVGEKGAMTPMVFDPKAGKSSPLSADLPRTLYTAARFSLDGKRVTVVGGGQSLREVDLASGKVVAAPPVKDGLESLVYTPQGLYVTHVVRTGDLWLADDPFGE